MRKPAPWLIAWATILIPLLAGLSGCGTINFQVGSEFDPTILEQSLKTGVSNRSDVKAIFGAPYGQGRAMMPFHDEPRTVWTYFYEYGGMALGGDESHDHRKYLFVFFLEGTFDGYMWFDSQLQ